MVDKHTTHYCGSGLIKQSVKSEFGLLTLAAGRKTNSDIMLFVINICDVIQGNQSEVEHVIFSGVYLIEVLIWRGTFC